LLGKPRPVAAKISMLATAYGKPDFDFLVGVLSIAPWARSRAYHIASRNPIKTIRTPIAT
jgi:hypothetical protein